MINLASQPYHHTIPYIAPMSLRIPKKTTLHGTWGSDLPFLASKKAVKDTSDLGDGCVKKGNPLYLQVEIQKGHLFFGLGEEMCKRNFNKILCIIFFLKFLRLKKQILERYIYCINLSWHRWSSIIDLQPEWLRPNGWCDRGRACFVKWLDV